MLMYSQTTATEDCLKRLLNETMWVLIGSCKSNPGQKVTIGAQISNDMKLVSAWHSAIGQLSVSSVVNLSSRSSKSLNLLLHQSRNWCFYPSAQHGNYKIKAFLLRITTPIHSSAANTAAICTHTQPQIRGRCWGRLWANIKLPKLRLTTPYISSFG